MSKIINKIAHKSLTAFVFSLLGIMVPMLASATITPNDLVNKSFTSKCSFTSAGALDDLGHILQYNLCGKELLDKQDIAQCSRVALTQYTVCRYTSVLNNSTTFISASSDTDKITADSNNAMNYSPDITTADSNDNKTTKHKIFNWF